ncbi:hypothetical protein ITJ43_14815 [Microbacterium sp. VKM Ac-2870]|uniref:hypothetical protein n=1 Tax=Microbacterium sp. VKM Ac-2870 TaxID=2783825 RepID=UPI00188AF626|nr:hypothetical protein [Microbacterium sp. VKM Ac-2870]MBF4563402.1 hypothetical protein [Microbacterium sp. VKM Ac-2870]
MDAEPDPDETAKATEEASAPPERRRLKSVSYGWRITIGVFIYLVIAFVTVLYAPEALLNNWITGDDTAEKAKVVAAAGNLVLLALGGVIAVVTVGLSMSRHHQEREAAERDRQRLDDDRKREQARRDEVEAQRRIDTERALRERFVTTVKLLSDPAPVNRQAALFALGALADDWDAFGKPDEVQVCIEVLTGYLRAPRTDDMLEPLTQEEYDQLEPAERRAAQSTTSQEVAVKQAGYTVIRNHLGEGAAPHWRDRSINLARAHIDFPLALDGATISSRGKVDLGHATITGGGALYLTNAKIRGKGVLDVSSATISRGAVYLTRAKITDGGNVYLDGAKISGGGIVVLARVNIDADARVLFEEATISDNGRVVLLRATISGRGALYLTDAKIRDSGKVNLLAATVSDNGSVFLEGATLSDRGTVDLRRTTISDDGTVFLEGATLSDRGTVDLRRATISDRGIVDLTDAKIRDGGTVNLEGATIWEGGLQGYTSA